MSVIKKVLLTLVMMLVWGIGKEVAQKLQGSNAGFLTLIVSIVCVTIILDIWSGFFLFSKKIESSDSIERNYPVKDDSYLRTINNVSLSMPKKQYVMPIQVQKHISETQRVININNDIASSSEVINDEEFYLLSTKEVDDDNQDQALWAKCMALCEGDEKKAKYMYIKDRVGRLVLVEKNRLDQKNKQEIIQIEIKEKEKRRQLMDDKVNALLDTSDKRALKKVLNKNFYDYYENLSGRYILTYNGKRISTFDNQEDFYKHLKKLIPDLE